jgi:putative membrane protein
VPVVMIIDSTHRRLRRIIPGVMLLLVSATAVFAHEGKPHNWHDLWRSWSFEPLVIVTLVLSGALYGLGVRQLWNESGPGRGLKRWEAACFAGGWFVLFMALVSPVHAWGQVLFSAHMTQHELLMLVAAPLLVLGRPIIAFMWAIPLSWSRRLGNFAKARVFQSTWHVFTIPLVAWVVHAIALWIWHVPSLFDAVLHSELMHTLQHLSFLLSALLFWWALIHGPKGSLGYGAAVLYVFTTSLHSGLLGALLTFSRSVWYPSYIGLTNSWGLTPLDDQQLGGLIMWIPAGLVYLFAGLILVVGWMRASELRMQKAERRRARVIEATVPANS